MRASCALFALAAALAAGCATVPQAPRSAASAAAASSAPGVALPVRNAGFEDEPVPGRACPPSWWCTMHADPRSFAFELASDSRSHGRYLRVKRVKPEPWALVTQAVPAAGLAGKRFRLSVAVDTGALEGADANAGPVVVLHGPGGRPVDRREVLLRRGPGWQRAIAEIDVPAGIEVVEIGLVVHGGGSAGFDDVEASASALPRPER